MSMPGMSMSDEELFREGVLVLAVEVLSSMRGTGHSPRPGVVAYMRRRLREWTTPHPGSKEFDDAAKAIVMVALKEWDQFRQLTIPGSE